MTKATHIHSLSIFPQQNGDKNTLSETSVLYGMKFTQGNLRRKENICKGTRCLVNPPRTGSVAGLIKK